MQYITIQFRIQAACLEDVSAGLVVHLLAAVEHIHHDPDGPGDRVIDDIYGMVHFALVMSDDYYGQQVSLD